MDTFEVDHCWVPSTEGSAVCTSEYLYPQCLNFHEKVTTEEWDGCLANPKHYKGDGYDYGKKIREEFGGSGGSNAFILAPLKITSLLILTILASICTFKINTFH